jgi:hypothetical protein
MGIRVKTAAFEKYAKRNGEVKAKARKRHVPGEMNSHEAKYAALLEAERLAGRVDSWQFEPMALYLADNLRYHPDFMVIYANGEIEIHEVKGFWRDDAKAKIKVAATAFPMFVFRAFTLKGGKWEETEFKPR